MTIELTDLEVSEVSAVEMPANPDAQIVYVKSKADPAEDDQVDAKAEKPPCECPEGEECDCEPEAKAEPTPGEECDPADEDCPAEPEAPSELDQLKADHQATIDELNAKFEAIQEALEEAEKEKTKLSFEKSLGEKVAYVKSLNAPIGLVDELARLFAKSSEAESVVSRLLKAYSDTTATLFTEVGHTKSVSDEDTDLMTLADQIQHKENISFVKAIAKAAATIKGDK